MMVTATSATNVRVAHGLGHNSTASQQVMHCGLYSRNTSLYSPLKGLKRHRALRTNVSSTEQQQSSTTSNKYRVSLFDAMKVFGPAPERINARLAMITFIPMVLREMETSETILQQFANPDYRIVALCLVTIYASMVPILKGAKDEDFGFMKVRVEKVNGRFAMLAWLTIMGLEYVAGNVCFF